MSKEGKHVGLHIGRKCRRCGNNKGLIRKYSLYLCRRCFKNVAEKIGFRKYS